LGRDTVLTVRIEAMMASSSGNSGKLIRELRMIESRFNGQVSLSVFEMDLGALGGDESMISGILGSADAAVFINGVRLEDADYVLRDFASIISADKTLACSTVLNGLKRIAVVGASREEEKPAHYVPDYLSKCGFEVFPINPNARGFELFGKKCVGMLSDLKGDGIIDVVEVFRPSGEVDKIVDEAISLGRVLAVWVQSGIMVSPETVKKGIDAGMIMITDECMMKKLAEG